jgi:hypothetical protein
MIQFDRNLLTNVSLIKENFDEITYKEYIHSTFIRFSQSKHINSSLFTQKEVFSFAIIQNRIKSKTFNEIIIGFKISPPSKPNRSIYQLTIKLKKL